jgi:pentatricopeptide repeat protein
VSNKWEEAVELLDLMASEGMGDVISLNTVLKALGKGRESEKAIAMLAAHRPFADSISYNCVLHACTRAGQLQEALGVLADMDEAQQQYSSVVVDCHTISTVIAACAKVGDSEKALELFESMVERDPPAVPDVFTYSSVINAFVAGAKWQAAIDFLDRIWALPDGAPRPNTVCYGAALRGCFKAREPEVALRLLNEMQQHDIQPDIVCFNDAASACAEAEHWSSVLEVFKAAEESDTRLNKLSLELCVAALRATDQLDLAALKQEEIGARFGSSSAFSSGVLNACKRGKWAAAVKLVLDLGRQAWQKETAFPMLCTNAISCATKAGKWSAALSVLDCMKGQGIPRDNRSFSCVISAFAQAQEWQRACDMVDGMVAEGITPDRVAFNCVLHALSRCGQGNKAVEVLSSMRALSVAPDLISFNCVIAACCEADLFDQGEVALGQALEAGITPTYATFFPLIEKYGRRGEIAKAQRIDTQMGELGVNKPPTRAWTTAGPTPLECINGWGSDAMSRACERTIARLVQETSFEFDFNSLPVLFNSNETVSEHTKRRSLTYHAEKKILAQLLVGEAGASTLPTICVNCKMCCDCHSAFCNASALFNRKIECRDGCTDERQKSGASGFLHVFQHGKCSCGGRWRKAA